MPQKDIVSKQLLKRLALDMARYLFGLEVSEAELVETEFQRVEDRRADVVLRVRAPGRYLLHIEIQNNNDRLMAERMLRYWLDIHLAYPGEEIRQYVIYIGKDRLRMAERLETQAWFYCYHIVDMHQLNCEAFLQQNNPDALVLAVLCDFKGRPEREVVRHILSRLHSLLQDNLQSLRDYVGMLEILSTNRNLQSVVHEEKTMLSMIDLNELPSYQIGRQSGFQEGRLEGRLEGRQEGLAEFLILQLEKKFGSLSARRRGQIRRADTTKLVLWGERLLKAETLANVFAEADVKQ